MVILQFNKLIRNKWVWGAFAVAVSVAFCAEGLFRSNDEKSTTTKDVGELNGEKIDSEVFESIRQDVIGYGSHANHDIADSDVEDRAHKIYAALKTAEKNDIVISDAQLADQLISGFTGPDGAFDPIRYKQFAQSEYGMTTKQFEALFRRQLLLQSGIYRSLVPTAAWVSPMELDQAVADVTDHFTVRVAEFNQSKAEADAVHVDKDAIRKWYDEHVKSLALPDLVKIRMIRFDATDSKYQSKVTLTEDALRDYYDANLDRYQVTDTNGVETAKKFEDVKDEIEKEVRLVETIDFLDTNLTHRVYANFAEGEDTKASRLDKIAAEEGLKVSESGWFAADGSYHEGFTQYAQMVCPGADMDVFLQAVAECDSESQDFRYQFVRSERAVWLIEKKEVVAAHTPSYEEASEKIFDLVLRDARQDAFKATVEAVAAKGADAVLALEGVSTNYTFSVAEGVAPDAFEHSREIIPVAMRLKKGEVSKFTPVGYGHAVLVVCVDRVAGDSANAILTRAQARQQLSSQKCQNLSEKWNDWNLSRQNFKAPVDAEATDEGVVK